MAERIDICPICGQRIAYNDARAYDNSNRPIHAAHRLPRKPRWLDRAAKDLTGAVKS